MPYGNPTKVKKLLSALIRLHGPIEGGQLQSRMSKSRVVVWVGLYIALLILIGAVKACLK